MKQNSSNNLQQRMINVRLLDRIEQINWFAQCGSPLNLELLISHRQVFDLETAIKECSSGDWEDTTLDARNALTAYLFVHHRPDYNSWNQLAMDARDFIQNSVVQRVEKTFNGEFSQNCLSAVKWDIHSAIMEDVYAYLDHPSYFFRQLLYVYEAGHFPCGWTGGEYPNGTLLIY